MEQAAGDESVVGPSWYNSAIRYCPSRRSRCQRPLGGIDIGTGGAIELVAPDERQGDGLTVRRRRPGPEQSQKQEDPAIRVRNTRLV